MKKVLLLLSILFSIQEISYGQILNETFNTGLPSNWTQGTGNVTWMANAGLGVSSSGCAMADFSSSNGQGGNWYQTPFMNLSSVNNPDINFSVALVGNNTVAPNVSLWYDIGSGWQQLSSWGGAAAANSATQTFDTNPPLSASNVTWVPVTYDLAAVASNTNIRFSFGSDFSNGGWVLLDNVSIQAGQASNVYNLPYTQDFEGGTFIPTDWEAFGGTNSSWQRSTTVGGFGTSSACMFFDNFSNPATNGNFYGLRCVPLTLAGSVKPTLEFDVAYAQRTGSNSDRLGIWYSLNGTSGWTNLQNYDNAALVSAPSTASSFTPTATQWKKITLDLSQFNTASYIRFAFENNSSFGNMVYVDNVHFFDDNSSTPTNDIDKVGSQMKIYPNPSKGSFILQPLKAGSIKEVTLYTMLGERLTNAQLSFVSGLYTIDLSNSPSGIYFVAIQTNKGAVHTARLVKE